MSEVTLRPATAADAEALAAVYRSAYQENRELGFPAKAGSATHSGVADWIGEYQVFVAVADGAVVGGVRLEQTSADVVKLSRLGVHEDRKGEGVGGCLLDRAEAWGREQGAERIRLTTPGEHPFLPDIYRGRGYERAGTYPLEYREYDEIVMEKRLDGAEQD